MHHYRELVKRQLLLNGGDKVHLSKNPIMSGWVESLVEAFPDARIVVMVRNPQECIPSCLKLVQASGKGKGWRREDYEQSLDILAELSYEHFEHPRKTLASLPQTPHAFVDYRELTQSPTETVHSVYNALGMQLDEAYDSWLKAQAEREKKHHSKFEYSLGEFRLSSTEIQQRLAGFYEEYQWNAPGEEKHNAG